MNNKTFATCFASLLCAASLSAQSIAFIGFNADGTDNLAFVALSPISGSTTIFFTDNELSSTAAGWADTNESGFSWTAPLSGVDAGQVVQFAGLSSSGTLSASIGSLANSSLGSNFGLANGGDTVFAYLGTAATATSYLAAISSNSDAFSTATNATGLVAGVNAIRLTSGTDIGAYNGPRSGQSTSIGYQTIINDLSNWTMQDGSGDQSVDSTFPDVPFNSTAFTVSPIPEPASAAALVGFAALGLVASRRRRA